MLYDINASIFPKLLCTECEMVTGNCLSRPPHIWAFSVSFYCFLYAKTTVLATLICPKNLNDFDVTNVSFKWTMHSKISGMVCLFHTQVSASLSGVGSNSLTVGNPDLLFSRYIEVHRDRLRR